MKVDGAATEARKVTATPTPVPPTPTPTPSLSLSPSPLPKQAQQEQEGSDLEARIDLTVGNGDAHSERIWRRALAAAQGVYPPNGLPELTTAQAQRLADRHRKDSRAELADLWQDIADALGNSVAPTPTATPAPTPLQHLRPRLHRLPSHPTLRRWPM